MMSLWDALRMNMMISYQELVRTFLSEVMPTAHPAARKMAKITGCKTVSENVVLTIVTVGKDFYGIRSKAL